jgi:hypothetical protein
MLAHQARTRRAIDQIVVAPARHDHVAHAARAQRIDDEAAEKPGSPRDHDALAGQIHHRALNLADLTDGRHTTTSETPR